MKKGKFILFVILCILFFVLMSACAEVSVENNSGQAAEGYRDMNGQKFYFVGSVIPKNERDYTDEELKTLTGNTLTLAQEAMMDHALVVEQNTNCMIVMEGLGGNNSANFAAAYAAGEMKADFIHCEIQFARNLFISEVIAPISELEAIDPTDYEKWGNDEVLMSTTYQGELFGFPCIGSNYYPYPLIYYGTMLCKTSAFDSFGLDTTPREMIENGKWTFDGFADLLPQLTSGSTEDDSKIYSFVHSNLPFCSVFANGGSVVTYERGEYVFGYTKKNAITALEWAKSIYRTDGCSEVGAFSGADISGFIDDRVVFMLTNGNRVFNDVSNGTAGYIWLPFPYGPDVEYGSTVAGFSQGIDSVVSVMKNPDPQRTQDSAYVMNELFEPTEYFGKTGYDDYLFRYYFDDGDTASFNTYKTQGMQRHYIYFFELDKAWGSFTEYLGNSMTSSGSVINYMSAVEGAVNSALDKTMNSDI